jgi:hypothetical protein
MSQAIRSLFWLVLILAIGALVVFWDQGRQLPSYKGASLGTPVPTEVDPYKDFK